DTVIPHQNSLRKLPGGPAHDQFKGQARLAGARRPTDQDCALSHLDRGGMDAGVRTRHGSGSLTTKRAPATVGSPAEAFRPGRFSAQMRPPCASMICLEIESPRPEFWPKPWCGRLV